MDPYFFIVVAFAFRLLSEIRKWYELLRKK